MTKSISAGETQHQGVLSPKKRLLIFDDSLEQLGKFVDYYNANGFQATGIPIVKPEHAAAMSAFQVAACVYDRKSLHEKLIQFPPDAILTDGTLDNPKFDKPKFQTTPATCQGEQLIDWVRQEIRDIPAIIHTGGFNDDSLHHKGPYTFISKEANPAIIVNFLKEKLANGPSIDR